MRCNFLMLLWAVALVLSACQSRAGGAAVRLSTAHPGVEGYAEPLEARINARWRERAGTGYKPRTRHLNKDGTPQFTNRLFLETSPYLLRHAHNPVDWYPWGDEAFAAARRLGRPVFLSIGYSTCHWCHVMEEESFEDLEIARYLNEHYIAIKVDREERPDVDAIYMAAVQAFTGRGGWPMSVWLSGDRKPFYAGTYFPARDGDRGARVGFLTMIGKLSEAWETRREDVLKNGEIFAREISGMLAPAPAKGVPPKTVLAAAGEFYASRYDANEGGLKGAPKFPSSLPVRFLLRTWRRTGERRWLDMAVRTLDKMARGGICDQVGGGFHRYSTDGVWLAPHFEKMLYDNALLVVVYLEAYQASGREAFARTAREILRYLDRDMGSPEGAFYSATDADSPNPAGKREEGWFFTWTPGELEAVLGAKRAAVVGRYYGVTERGNFDGRSILHVADPEASGAKEALAARDALYAARLKRPAPLRDEKILAAWNGLAISAYAFAGLVLDDPKYTARAERAADFLLTKMRRNGRLRRSYKDGEARLNAYLDDYAFTIAGLLDLYEASGRPRWMEEAIALDRVLAEHYEDPAGGFFLTSGDHEHLLAREKPASDGAAPSGDSVMALNLLRLYEFTTRESYRRRAEGTLRAFGTVLERAPAALSEMLLAVDFYYDRPREIVIVTPGEHTGAAALLAEFRTRFLPSRVLAVLPAAKVAAQSELLPIAEGKTARHGQPTAYVCEQGVCELPASSPAEFAERLATMSKPGRD